MANLLTFERMQFLMDKMGAGFEGTGYERYKSGRDYVLFDDLSANTVSNARGKFCFISGSEIYNYNDQDYDYGVVAIHFYDNGKTTYYALINPKKLRATNAQYPIGTPLYVGTKRVNQAICKVGGYSRRYKGYTSNRTGVSKRSCRAGVAA